MHILLVKVALGMDKVVLQSLVKALVVLVALPCALCCSGPAAGGKLHRRWAEEQPFVVQFLLVKLALGMDKVVPQSLAKASILTDSAFACGYGCRTPRGGGVSSRPSGFAQVLQPDLEQVRCYGLPAPSLGVLGGPCEASRFSVLAMVGEVCRRGPGAQGLNMQEAVVCMELFGMVPFRQPGCWEPCWWRAFPVGGEVPGLRCRAWIPSRRVRNKLFKALHGNIAMVVANVGALSNLCLAVRSKPDVAQVQELWATVAEVRRAANELGYEAACAAGDPCLAAVLFRPGQGQQIQLPPLGAFTSRVAAACISLGGGCGCCLVSAYGARRARRSS